MDFLRLNKKIVLYFLKACNGSVDGLVQQFQNGFFSGTDLLTQVRGPANFNQVVERYLKIDGLLTQVSRKISRHSIEETMKYIKPTYISMKQDEKYNEKWAQELIAADPSILGLGELILVDKERIQPRAGRLDLLLRDSDVETKRRYEIELQLGSIDEAHIIRTIEYWDMERKRYPQYDHCAVIIAEDITSRFLNVVSLFNGTIPLIAIQMKAIVVGDSVTLIFTKVMDELTRGLVDEDEDANAAPADRSYWEARGTKSTVQLADALLEITKTFDSKLELKYNKFYIGLSKEGQPFNIVVFRPRKSAVNVELKLIRTDEIDRKISEAGIETLDYSNRWGTYRLTLKKEDIAKNKAFLTELIGKAYEGRSA